MKKLNHFFRLSVATICCVYLLQARCVLGQSLELLGEWNIRSEQFSYWFSAAQGNNAFTLTS
ncbi:MAG TPA: hypothetical protein VM260_13830, partial [Pirellula sp.]|nr:hypothetical protein [Pirellula sp.]